MAKALKRRGTKPRADSRRWFLVPLALGGAAVVGWVILAGPTPPVEPLRTRPETPNAQQLVQESGFAEPQASELQHAEIREASREQLLDILRSADAGENR